MGTPENPDDLDRDPADDGIATVASAAPRGASAPALRAVVIEGVDAGRAFEIDPEAPSRILLGTGPACAIRLADPQISRRHLAFELDEERWRVVDLGSTNGTAIDGVMIRDAFVRGQEIVRCGGTAIRLVPEQAASAPAKRADGFGRVLGKSSAMRRLYPLCEKLAVSSIPTVIEGETGTGKETLAESLHAASGRAGPFVVLDCTAVSPATIESELFGVDASAGPQARAGYFEQAHGGTLFIDEIGELDPSLQPKLLRALERGEVKRLGATQSSKVDVRVIVATRRDLDKEVAAGRFRDDLFHRLAVARIELPPLRERQGDVRLLALHFAKQLGAPDALGEDVLARFEADAWPGNVRELRNAVVRTVAIGALGDVGRDSSRAPEPTTPEPAGSQWADDIVASGAPLPVARRRLIEEFERRYVQRILAQHDGNVSQAALASGIALRYFQLVKARAHK